MAKPARTRTTSKAEARVRLHSADAHLEVAELVLGDPRAEMPGVSAALAVLAGIAASDVVCASRLGHIHRGDDHRAAGGLLATATPDGTKLAGRLLRLIDIKDEAHYGVTHVSSAKATRAIRAARELAKRAREELER